jgi:hypothetical protein
MLGESERSKDSTPTFVRVFVNYNLYYWISHKGSFGRNTRNNEYKLQQLEEGDISDFTMPKSIKVLHAMKANGELGTLLLQASPMCSVSIFQYMSNKMQLFTVIYIWKLLYMFWLLLPPIIRSAYSCIYSIWYLFNRYCYLPLYGR